MSDFDGCGTGPAAAGRGIDGATGASDAPVLTEVRGGTLADAAIWGGILSTAFAVMQFLFGPVVGSLSDRFGRRPVLLVSLVAMAADYVVMALAHTIWLLLAARIVGGITAAVIAQMIQANPKLTPQQVYNILTATAKPRDDFDSHRQGAGLLDAPAAVLAAKELA